MLTNSAAILALTITYIYGQKRYTTDTYFVLYFLDKKFYIGNWMQHLISNLFLHFFQECYLPHVNLWTRPWRERKYQIKLKPLSLEGGWRRWDPSRTLSFLALGSVFCPASIPPSNTQSLSKPFLLQTSLLLHSFLSVSLIPHLFQSFDPFPPNFVTLSNRRFNAPCTYIIVI